MAAKRRKLVAEDFDIGFGSTTIPTDSGGLRQATKTGIQTFLGTAYLNPSNQSGVNLGVQIQAAHDAIPSTGGIIDGRGLTGAQIINSTITVSKPNVTILLGAYTITASAGIVINDGISNCHIVGGASGAGDSGVGATIVNYSAAGYFISVAATAVPPACWIENLYINTTSTSSSAGAIKIGSPAQAFSNSLYRNDWIIKNVVAYGPGSGNAGTVGVSLTQMGRLRLDNLHIIGYETDLILCADTETNATSVTLDDFVFGFNHNYNSGYTTGAGAQSRFACLTAHGPDAGTTGYGIYEELSGNQYFAPYLETGVSTINSAMRFGATSRFNDVHAMRIDTTGGTPTNIMVFDAGAAANKFFGGRLNTNGVPLVSMGAPSVAGSNQFYGMDTNMLTALATPLSNGYCTYDGLDATDVYKYVGPRLGVNMTPAYPLDVTGAGRISGVLRASSDFLLAGAAVLQTATVFANGDTTPAVSAGNMFITNNAAPTSITTFDNGSNGQIIIVRFADATTTLVNGATMVLKDGLNATPGINNVITLFKEHTGGVWIELCRNY